MASEAACTCRFGNLGHWLTAWGVTLRAAASCFAVPIALMALRRPASRIRGRFILSRPYSPLAVCAREQKRKTLIKVFVDDQIFFRIFGGDPLFGIGHHA